MIHQELSPVPYMTVAENIWLGREPLGRFGMIDKRKMLADTRALLNRLEININPDLAHEGAECRQHPDGGDRQGDLL